MDHLVIVSNRGPFSFSKEFFLEAKKRLRNSKEPQQFSFGEGGLVKAMAGLLKSGRWKPTWIGASMGDEDIDVARGHYTRFFKKMIKEKYAPDYFPNIHIDPDYRMHFKYKEYDFYMRFVFFDTKHMHSYYNKFANGFLWPLMHLTRSPLFYKKAKAFPRPHFENTDFVQYTSSGVTFANTVLDEIQKNKDFWKNKEDIIIWNQDYHLLRIAEAIKALMVEEGFSEEVRKKMHVGQFIHTPFFDIHEIQDLIREDKRKRVKDQIYDPFAETIETALQKLTWGMLSNDFIGFHTKLYCDNYLEALEEWFPVDIKIEGDRYEINHQDRITTVGSFPIGLDVDIILSEVSKGKNLLYKIGGKSLYREIKNDKDSGKYIFGGLDRCDYTKGLFERLNIYYYALKNLRNIKKDARFYQVTAPSRSDNPDYKDLENRFKKEVSATNRKLDENNIVHIDKGIPAPQNYRFMKEIDVMVVTPLDDGMNLVSFEYILSQKYKKPEDRGFLLLSTCGASRVLSEKNFDEQDGIIYINPMNAKNSGEMAVSALKKGCHISDKVIMYVQNERRVDDWAMKNIEATLNSKK